MNGSNKKSHLIQNPAPSVSLLRSAKKTGQDPRKQLSFNGLP